MYSHNTGKGQESGLSDDLQEMSPEAKSEHHSPRLALLCYICR